MKKILLFITALTLTSFTNAAIAQDSVLDFELVQKDLLDKWVEDYGFSNLDALAENGDPVAQRRLGRYYSSVKNDNYTAVKWYKKGAENNDFFAIANLGAMYHNGDGVTENRYEALEWYKKAFELDVTVDKDILIQSMENLNGINWTNEYRAGWYLDDAPRGNMLSQFHLASFYEKGYGGLQEDFELAKKWYEKAAYQGFKPAIEALINLEDEEFVKVEEIVEVEDGKIKEVNEPNLYGVWTVKKLVSKSATIKNVDHIIDEEQYEPLKNALSKSKFIIKADHSFTMIIDYPEFGDYFLDVRWSLDESKIVIVDKPGGPLESEGLLLEIQVEQTEDETIFIMTEGLFYLYVEKSTDKLKIKNEYHINGALKSTGPVNASGQKTGEWKEYYNNGKLQAVGGYVDGEFDGKWEGYYPSSTVEYTRFWKMGKRAKFWMEYYDTGELYRTIRFGESYTEGSYLIYEKNGALKSSGFIFYDQE